MRVLVIDDHHPRAGAAERALREAGHEIRRCHPVDAPAFPCTGMSGTCPVDEGVDAALVMRRVASAASPPAEDGARCAARADVALVMSGAADPNPYAAWTVATVDDSPAAIITAVARGGTDPVPRLSALVSDAAVIALAHRGVATDAVTGEVRRRGADLAVTIDPGVPVDAATASALGVRALAALDGVRASTIDVAVRRG
jgi:hypothetical protein